MRSHIWAFFIDFILIGHMIHLGYLMMHHMMSCCKSKTRVLSYGRFPMKVYKDVGIDLTKEKDVQVPTIYKTYNYKLMN